MKTLSSKVRKSFLGLPLILGIFAATSLASPTEAKADWYGGHCDTYYGDHFGGGPWSFSW